jgi:hypothetical protein
MIEDEGVRRYWNRKKQRREMGRGRCCFIVNSQEGNVK